VNLERIAMLLPEGIRPDGRFLRFLLVGGVNTAFGYGCFVACLWLGMHYALAAAVATALGVLFNYKSTGTFVFRNRGNRRLPRFFAVYVVVYIANVSALALMLRVGIPEWLGGLVLILPSAMLSYVLNRQFVFPP
jgi:putative flippase GtrA